MPSGGSELLALDPPVPDLLYGSLVTLLYCAPAPLRSLECLTRWRMDEPAIHALDESGYGLQMPERLLVEAYIHRADISHMPGWETGRDSEPDYMDLNLHAMRAQEIDRGASDDSIFGGVSGVGDTGDMARVVVCQIDESAPLNPRGLLVAYEEHGHVLPVASDFDAFLIGSKGLVYPPTDSEQLPYLSSLLRHIESILCKPGTKPWSQRWLEVIKHWLSGPDLNGRRLAGSLGGKRADLPYGFGDAMSKSIIEHSVRNSTQRRNGAVRHAAESFNYYWPQARHRKPNAVPPHLLRCRDAPMRT